MDIFSIIILIILGLIAFRILVFFFNLFKLAFSLLLGCFNICIIGCKLFYKWLKFVFKTIIVLKSYITILGFIVLTALCSFVNLSTTIAAYALIFIIAFNIIMFITPIIKKVFPTAYKIWFKIRQIKAEIKYQICKKLNIGNYA